MSAKRPRPADGGMVWRPELNAFECLGGCEDFFQVFKRCERDNPETMASLREMLIVDHTECWEFDDPRMAADARKYRKKKKRLANLAAQRVGWRGQSEMDRQAAAIRERWQGDGQ